MANKKTLVYDTKEAPSWYQTPPLSNANDLYAIGEGKDKEEAIANGLSLMVSTLSVSISSSYNAKTVVKEGRVNASEGVYENEVQSEVKKIRISNYEVLGAESMGFKKYAVLLKSNKKKLFESMRQEIEQELALIADKEKMHRESNALKKLSFYKNAKLSLTNLPNTIIVMNSLNPAFNGKSYLHAMQNIDIKYENILKNLSFAIHSDAAASNLKGVVAKALSEKKIQLKKSGKEMHFSVYIKSKSEQASAYGFALLRSEISIITMDHTGSIVGSNTLNIVGQSSQGYGVAMQDVAIRFNQLVEKEGIAKLMGLDI